MTSSNNNQSHERGTHEDQEQIWGKVPASAQHIRSVSDAEGCDHDGHGAACEADDTRGRGRKASPRSSLRQDHGTEDAPGSLTTSQVSRPLGRYAKTRAKPALGEATEPTKWELQTVAAKLVRDDRVRWCCRNLSFTAEGVEIRQRADDKRASFYGLQTCGSVWMCPVCAAKVSEARRTELVEGVATWKGKEGGMVLATLTHPHHQGDSLHHQVAAIIRAQARMYRSGTMRRVLKELGIVGRVRALEVTHGRNGWHPHVHVIMFSSSRLTAEEQTRLHRTLIDHWQRCCVAEGLPMPDGVYGVDVRDGSEAAKYASKWGIESEVTRLHTKRGTEEKGRTPFDLLRACIEKGTKSKEANLFKEYARVFKGKRQLVWTRGLRALLGLITEKTDEEIANEPEPETYTACVMSPWQWRCVYRLDLRGQLLEWVQVFGPINAMDFLNAAIAADMPHNNFEQRRPDIGDPLDFEPNEDAAIRIEKLSRPITDAEDLFIHAPLTA